MFETTLREIVPGLQVTTSPVILISGVGPLLLTMSNRPGGVVEIEKMSSLTSPENLNTAV